MDPYSQILTVLPLSVFPVQLVLMDTEVQCLRGDIVLLGLTLFNTCLYDNQFRRHNVKPGISAAQISGQNSLTWDEKISLDVFNVDTHNLLLDFHLARCYFYGSVNYQFSGHATVEPFVVRVRISASMSSFILGAGGHANVVLETALCTKFSSFAFLDDRHTQSDTPLHFAVGPSGVL